MKGFTLIEVLIVMIIFTALMSLGILGVVRFKNYIELQNGFSDTTSYIRTLQNNARNLKSLGVDSSSNPISPDIYALYFYPENFAFLSCVQSGANYNCTNVTEMIKASTFNNVLYEKGTNCGNGIIAFEKSTANIVKLNGTVNKFQGKYSMNNAVLNDSGTCTITITHNNISNTRVINVDFITNTLNFEN